MNKKFIALLIVIMLVGMGLTIYLMIELNREPIPEEDIDEPIIVIEEPTDTQEEKPGEKDTGDNLTDFDRMPSLVLPSEGDELTANDEFNVLSSVRHYYREFSFKEAGDYLAGVVTRYTINPESNPEIYQLYMDSAPLQHLENAIKGGDESSANLINAVRDPENHLLGVLMIPGGSRVRYIRDNDSLNPEFEGLPYVHSVREATDNRLLINQINVRDEDEKTIHEFLFTVEGNSLRAYVVETVNRTYVYRIEEVNPGSTHYYTIRELEDALRFREEYDRRRREQTNPALVVEEINGEGEDGFDPDETNNNE